MRSHPKQSDAAFPMRINKYLAYTNQATRREGDELVAKRQVLINGRVALLGDKVEAGDTVEVRRRGKPKDYVYFAYHKPAGIITHSPQGEEKDIATVTEDAPELKGCFPIGRLDKASRGLILLTNDGRITDRLLNPKYPHEKEYRVKTREPLQSSFAKKMEAGVDIEGERTKPCTVQVLGEHTFSIILSEGKKHQIRRMVSAMRNEVADLKRVRIMNIKLGTLRAGEYRPITGAELDAFLTSLGLRG